MPVLTRAFTTASAALLLSLCTAGARAQMPVPLPTTDPSVYRALGEEPGIVLLVDDFVARNLADPRTREPFRGINLRNLKKHIAEQFCHVSGGPCVYTGDTMRAAHQGYDITRAQFNAVVENLQSAMDARDVPFAVQRRFLAVLAPMYRDIVVPPGSAPAVPPPAAP